MRRLAVLLAAVALTAGVAMGQTAAALSAATSVLLDAEADTTDAEQRLTMPITTALPWGAVGFIDNGCTGALIDSRHVLAAGHCFILGSAWQTGLVFFPNYHPDRPNPPRVTIDRAIVGDRADTSAGPSSDWGIGHLAEAVTGFPSLAIDPLPRWRYPAPVTFAGYARDPAVFPSKFPQPAPGGFCPNFEFNCWWTPALIDPLCLAVEEQGGTVTTDWFSCLTQGGNSGSPVLWTGERAGVAVYRLTGVVSGAGSYLSASRFQHVPRRAAAVALGPRDDGAQGGQLFASDSDRGRVVSRQRSATTGPFSDFRDLAPVAGAGALAAMRLASGRPQLVVSGTGGLRTSFVGGDGNWQPWQSVAGPAGVSSFSALAATSDATHPPQLFVIGTDGALYTARASSASAGVTWGAWQKLAAGGAVQRVSAVRHGDGRQQLFVLSATGVVSTMWQTAATPDAAWTAPGAFGTTPALSDVTAGLTTDGRVQLFAVDTAGKTWTRTAAALSPSGSWSAWESWPVLVDAANIPPFPLDGVVSLTAGRWLETGTTGIPVVFALDEQGNIYVTTFEGGAWKGWRSFYN